MTEYSSCSSLRVCDKLFALDKINSEDILTYFATNTQALGGRIAWAVSGDNSRPILSSRGWNEAAGAAEVAGAIGLTGTTSAVVGQHMTSDYAPSKHLLLP